MRMRINFKNSKPDFLKNSGFYNWNIDFKYSVNNSL